MSTLTRESLAANKHLPFELPAGMRWSAEQIEQSRREAMNRRPGGGDVWIFAYGSLMWNPLLEIDRRVVATLGGWHRSFCVRAPAGRGSPMFPGRMLSLESGGTTQGVALRIESAVAEHELRLLWNREMVAGSYEPVWAPVTFEGGETVSVLVFVANPARPQYEADSSVESIAPVVACATGSFGTNADYVFRLHEALTECGAFDKYVEDLVAALRRFPHLEIPAQP